MRRGEPRSGSCQVATAARQQWHASALESGVMQRRVDGSGDTMRPGEPPAGVNPKPGKKKRTGMDYVRTGGVAPTLAAQSLRSASSSFGALSPRSSSSPGSRRLVAFTPAGSVSMAAYLQIGWCSSRAAVASWAGEGAVATTRGGCTWTRGVLGAGALGDGGALAPFQGRNNGSFVLAVSPMPSAPGESGR